MSLFRRRCACSDINDIFNSVINPFNIKCRFAGPNLCSDHVGFCRMGQAKQIHQNHCQIRIHPFDLTYGHMLNSWYGRSCQDPSVVFSLSNAFPGSGQSLLSYLVGIMTRFFCLLSDKHSSDYAERRYRRKCKI